MYFADSLACSQPNSATPMSAAQIAAQARRVAAVGSKFDTGNQTLNALINALGGDAVPSGAGDAGIPTTGVFPWFGIPSRNGGGGVPLSIGPGGGGPLAFTAATPTCSAPPKVLPLATVFPIPAAAPVPMALPPAPVVRAAPPVSAPAAPDTRPDPGDCSPANICAGLRDGCYLSSQVSSQQLLACAKAGWVGNRNLYPWLLARGGAGGGAFFGTPQPNPPQYSGSGMGFFDSGLFDTSSWGLTEYAIVGLGGYALFQTLASMVSGGTRARKYSQVKKRRALVQRVQF